MNGGLVLQLGYIYAANARVEGMKAENTARALQGLPPYYTENDFTREAINMEEAARAAAQF
jgi:hypothetical protein